jgi:hypothetical protein
VVGLALIITLRQNPPMMAGDGGVSQSFMLAAISNQSLAPYVSKHDTAEFNCPAAGMGQGTNLQPPSSRQP